MRSRFPWPQFFLLGVVILVALLVWWWPTADAGPDSTRSAKGTSDKSHQAPQAQGTDPATQQSVSTPPDVLEVLRADGKRELQAYRIAVRGGVVSLDGSERIAGDFHRRRGPQAWMPGMWCVRLMDANLRVLAEETSNAPDSTCVVLDPQNPDANGEPQATQFAGAGEEAMMQVRLPPLPNAKWLKVYRLSSGERADWNTEPVGQLLASFSLP